MMSLRYLYLYISLGLPLFAMNSYAMAQEESLKRYAMIYDSQILPIVNSCHHATVCQVIQKQVFKGLKPLEVSSIKNYCVDILRWQLAPCLHQDVVSSEAPASILAIGSGSSALLATGSNNGVIRLLDQNNIGLARREFKENADAVSGLALAEDNKKCVAMFSHTGGCVWDIETAQIMDLFVDTKRITSFALLPDLYVGICGREDGWHNLYDVRDGNLINSIKLNSASVLSLAALAHTQQFVSGGDNGDIIVYDLRKLPVCKGIFYQKRKTPVNVVCSIRDGTAVISGDDAGEIAIWDIAQQRCIKTLAQPDKDKGVRALAVAASFSVIAALRGREWYLWDYQKNASQKIGTSLDETPQSLSPQSLAFSLDEAKLFAAYRSIHGWIAHYSFEKIMKILAEK